MKIFAKLDTTGADVVLGNHGVWLPARGVKVPFQFGGRPRKRTRPQEQPGERDSIVDEVCILRALADLRMAPPVGDYVFFREVVSTFPGAWHCDPVGAYGYEIADARKLSPGKFDIEAMKSLPIEGSKGAWGDVAKPENIVNGYLVDVRRSQQDLLRWRGERHALPEVSYDGLLERVHRDCQFPAGERDIAYQDFWLGSRLVQGQRRVRERAQAFGFTDRLVGGGWPHPVSVLDVGTQSGSFLQYAHSFAPDGRFVGVDVDENYVSCAKALAQSCGQNICFRQMDVVREHDAFLSWVRSYFKDGVDHLLCLSLEKHLGEAFLFRLIDEVNAGWTYVETNAVGKESGPMKLWNEVQKRGGQHVGDSTDRNLRRLYRIGRR